MKIAQSLITALTLSACSVSALAGSELITNGGFEQYTGGTFSGFATVNAGSEALTGWRVGGISVDVINNGQYGAISGISIDMLGTPGPGSLSQSFATAVNQKYVLNFDLSLNYAGGNNSPLLSVAFGAGESNPVRVGSFAGTTGITHHTMGYTASSTSTTLFFRSAPDGYSGAVLDNVSVTAVPEPETYAMMLAGLGLMGFVARRRKQSGSAA